MLIVSGHLPPLYSREHYETTVAEAEARLRDPGRVEVMVPRNAGDHDRRRSPSVSSIGRSSTVVAELEPQIVLCPYWDRHIDHRLVFDSVMVATRPVGAGRRIELRGGVRDVVRDALERPANRAEFRAELGGRHHGGAAAKDRGRDVLPVADSRRFPGARSIEAIEALARFRGTQAGFAAGEGFHIIRMIG